MSVVAAAAAWIFSLRLSVVHVQVWYTRVFRGPRDKNVGASGLGILVAIQLVLFAQSMAQEELHPTSFTPY